MLVKSQGGNDDVTADISSKVDIPAITLDGSDGSDTLSSAVDSTTWNLTDSGSGILQSPVGTTATVTVDFISFEHVDAGKSKDNALIVAPILPPPGGGPPPPVTPLPIDVVPGAIWIRWGALGVGGADTVVSGAGSLCSPSLPSILSFFGSLFDGSDLPARRKYDQGRQFTRLSTIPLATGVTLHWRLGVGTLSLIPIIGSVEPPPYFQVGPFPDIELDPPPIPIPPPPPPPPPPLPGPIPPPPVLPDPIPPLTEIDPLPPPAEPVPGGEPGDVVEATCMADYSIVGQGSGGVRPWSAIWTA